MQRWQPILLELKWIGTLFVIVTTVWVTAWASHLQSEINRLQPAPMVNNSQNISPAMQTVDLTDKGDN